jgi:hypothetical protein
VTLKLKSLGIVINILKEPVAADMVHQVKSAAKRLSF